MSADAIGRTTTRTERLDRASLARFAVATGGTAEDAPPLAHWAWFLDTVPDEALGEDGHPRRGGFLPAVPHLPRRMFAGAEIEFVAPMTVDEPATLTATIADVRITTGKTGELMFVTLDHVITQRDVACIRERRTIVYREAGAPVALPAETQDGAWRPGPVQLFRFSAATFNAHRIHYDLDYARAAEGYPALVVHGPLTAARLAALAAERGALTHFAFRAQAPLFAGQPVTLGHTDTGCEAVRCDGAVAMRAEVRR